MQEQPVGEVITTSPLPEPVQKPSQLTFFQAIREVRDGRKITKLEWNNENIYGFLGSDGHLKINLPDKLSDWLLNDGDLNGEDYIVVSEKN